VLGQTSDRQVDCLRDVGVALGNSAGTLWEMRNGCALCSAHGLESIEQRLRLLDQTALDDLRGLLRIGLHWSVQVTDSGDGAVALWVSETWQHVPLVPAVYDAGCPKREIPLASGLATTLPPPVLVTCAPRSKR
jgi:hypothetical protein